MAAVEFVVTHAMAMETGCYADCVIKSLAAHTQV